MTTDPTDPATPASPLADEWPGEPAGNEMPFGEDFDDVDTLEHLAEIEGIGGMKVATTLLEDELRAKSPLRRILEIGLSVGITVAIFVHVIPQFLEGEYQDVWSRVARIDKPYLAFLFGFWFFTMWSYGGVLAATLPGLSRLQAMIMNFSGSALANVVPFGGAAGVGATYAQSLSWGFELPAITLSIIVTGVWNVFAKLGMPILVLTALLLTSQSSHGLGLAGILGFAVLTGAVASLSLVFKSDRLAAVVGNGVEGVTNSARRVVRKPRRHDLADKVVEFRHRTVGLVRRRWPQITFWMITYKASQAMLQLLCAKAVGLEGVGWIQIFAVYTFGELLSTIPVTPSGVGFVEGGSTQLLVAFGGQPAPALAAILCYRLFTYVLEIPLGAAGWLTWATRHSWRRAPGTAPA